MLIKAVRIISGFNLGDAISLWIHDPPTAPLRLQNISDRSIRPSLIPAGFDASFFRSALPDGGVSQKHSRIPNAYDSQEPFQQGMSILHGTGGGPATL